ncbi:MAG: hypothetical protein WBA97_36025 [Actinophytocola sp.]|uniref:hypothetical protein n=1 Tax=Actinophytocola sp. TaxID=1872138 RepID=UPI003C786E18
MTGRTVLSAVTLVVAALVVGLVLVSVTDSDAGGRDVPSLDLDSGLLVSTRTDFRVCVEAGPGTDRDLADRSLLAALDTVRGHPHWAQAFRRAHYDPASVITWGCPSPRLPSRYDRQAVAGPGVTADPSPYRVWIYLVDERTAARLLDPAGSPVVLTAEAMRDGANTVFPVSTALLIGADRVSDLPAVADKLREAAGLAAV